MDCELIFLVHARRDARYVWGMVIRALIVSGLIAAAAFAPNAYLWLMGALVIGGFAWSLYCRVTRGYWG